MGWFSKKDKKSTATSPDTAPANPYSAPPPAYDAGANTKTYTDTKSNMSGGYGSGAATYGVPKSTNPYAQGAPLTGANPYAAKPAAPTNDTYGSGGGYGNYGNQGTGGGYGSSAQANAEDDDDENADQLKVQIRATKIESVNSTRNALRAAARAEEVGRDTLERLGHQGEQLHNTEKNLDLAKAHGEQAEDQINHINRVNRSMFVPVAGSPFGREKRAQQEEERIMNRHQQQKDARAATNASGYEGKQAMKGLRPMGAPMGGPRQKMSLAEKAKFQFEADAEDDAMEEEIDDNLHQLGGAIGRLNLLAKATGQEVDRQNEILKRLDKKTDVIDTQLQKNTHRMDKIK
ncbi:hypothetical protein AA313_de0208646 [Arthrobotrys entomopaga]|nr:hypothetical protein AA313_de0208646 [Arthrobotrys entomopaga]